MITVKGVNARKTSCLCFMTAVIARTSPIYVWKFKKVKKTWHWFTHVYESKNIIQMLSGTIVAVCTLHTRNQSF